MLVFRWICDILVVMRTTFLSSYPLAEVVYGIAEFALNDYDSFFFDNFVIYVLCLGSVLQI